MLIVTLMIMMSSILITPFGYATILSYDEIADNSDVSTYSGHDVGAITYGIRWDNDCTIEGSSVFEVGVSAALGDDWYDQFSHYWIELESTRITLEAVDVWKDTDSDNIHDAGETSGSVNEVRYEEPHLAYQGSGSYLSELVDLMDYFVGLLSLNVPSPFSLMSGSSLSPCYTTISQTFGTYQYNALRGQVKYYGDVDEYITIKIKVTTRGDFSVNNEPLDTWVASRTITEISYIYITVYET